MQVFCVYLYTNVRSIEILNHLIMLNLFIIKIIKLREIPKLKKKNVTYSFHCRRGEKKDSRKIY